MDETRENIRRIIIGATAALMGVLLIRLLFIMFGANPEHWLSGLVLNLTSGFVTPFAAIGPNLFIGPLIISVPTFAAIIIYMLIGLIISEFVTAFIDTDPVNIVVNVVDAFLKLLEFLLAARIVLKLFGVTTAAVPFAGTIYSSTSWSQGLFPSFNFLWGEVEPSTIVLFIIVVIVDIALEGAVESYRERRKQSQQSKSSE
jgi:hypothetical protein